MENKNLIKVLNQEKAQELINLGYIDKDEITDPEKNTEVDGSVKIIYRSNNY